MGDGQAIREWAFTQGLQRSDQKPRKTRKFTGKALKLNLNSRQLYISHGTQMTS